MGQCKYEGCDYDAKGRGWCNKHYLRWWHHGTTAEPVRPTLAERFWSKVDRGDPSACWIWMASQDRKGYGQFMFGGKPKRAHRMAYQLTIGEIPKGLQLDHLCRNRLCVNPAHLEPVTNKENALRGIRAIPCEHGSRSHRDCSICRSKKAVA